MEETVARFALKDLVEVAPRTRPGFNFAGGTARVTKVHDERESDGGPLKDGSYSRTTKFTYGVRYVIGGSEKRVDAQHIVSKQLVSREALGEARQGELADRKAKQEAEAAEFKAKQDAAAAKKARARDKLAKRRAAAAEIERAAKRGKRSPAAATSTAGASGTEGESKKVASADDKDKKVASADDKDADQSPQRRDYADDAADDAADAQGLRWLHGVLVSATAAEETQDELELELFLETALAAASSAAPGAPGAGLDRAGVLELLRRLDTKNHIMLHDSTIYII